MKLNIDESWLPILTTEVEKPYFKTLLHFIGKAYKSTTCFPEKSKVFAAFDHCKNQNIKVVIIGQDPYHGFGQANGLCFSVNNGIPHPPSLKNIFKEIESDIGVPCPKEGNLEHWAKQGVLLLNATMTVQQANAGSHQNQGWEDFTDAVINQISKEKKDIVFMLWGGFAKKKIKLIDTKKHYVLTSGHPSPLSANRGYWFGNKHFSKCNSFLKSVNKKSIDWST